MVTFVDHVTLHLKAGNGGNGCVSIRREKFKPLAGPDGGNGAHGGDIIFVADPQVTTLLDYHRKSHRTSESGGFGMGDHRHGRRGANLELAVPIGTVIKDTQGTQLVDLSEPYARFVAALGGVGGLGNAALASAQRKAPGFALLGTPGWEGTLVLELKTVADVALVGYPSAGKSSLISSLSAAKPKIADYPFTTLHPHLGVVEAGQTRYTIADVPGLIEGAAEGKGLGLEFLRHIERCSILVHVIDCATLEPNRDPLSDFEAIRHELASYSLTKDVAPLLDRKQVIVLNKIDIDPGRELAEFVRDELSAFGYPMFQVSTVTHEGLNALSFELAHLVEQHRKEINEQLLDSPKVVLDLAYMKKQANFEVHVEKTSDDLLYRVKGEKPEKWIAQTDFTNDEAVGYLADRLAKLGVEDALVAHGAKAGATVVIGKDPNGVVFNWEPMLSSAAEVMTSRGTDLRISGSDRPTRAHRKQEYMSRMDAKAQARAELENERVSGFWDEET